MRIVDASVKTGRTALGSAPLEVLCTCNNNQHKKLMREVKEHTKSKRSTRVHTSKTLRDTVQITPRTTQAYILPCTLVHAPWYANEVQALLQVPAAWNALSSRASNTTLQKHEGHKKNTAEMWA